jgi:branched-chain amino acid transport system substrate-binding protein
LIGTEAVLVASVGTNLTNVIHQLRETGYRGQILMPSSGPIPEFFVMPDMQGVYLAAPIIHNPSYIYAREAGEKFTARFQKPFSMWAANGYDFIKLICGLFEDRTVSRQSVRDIMAGGFEYSGVFGHVRLRSGEHDLTFPVYPTQILNGTLKYR